MLELILYIFFTFGMWSIAVNNLVPDAYEYLQLSLPKNLRKYDGTELNPEGTENAPIDVFGL